MATTTTDHPEPTASGGFALDEERTLRRRVAASERPRHRRRHGRPARHARPDRPLHPLRLLRPRHVRCPKANFANLITQSASVIILAIGVTFVLLLGEIDLSAGYTAGVCVVTIAWLMYQHNVSPWIAIPVGFIIGAAIGTLTGFLVAKVGIPRSSRHWPSSSRGRAWSCRSRRGRHDPDQQRADHRAGQQESEPGARLGAVGDRRPRLPGYGVIARPRRGEGGPRSRADRIDRHQGGGARRRPGAPDVHPQRQPLVRRRHQEAGRRADRGPGRAGHGRRAAPVLSRTTWGRHVYAVGGNTEAARRAGINVVRVKMSCFIMCGVVACLAGMALAPSSTRSRRRRAATTPCCAPSAPRRSAASACSAAAASCSTRSSAASSWRRSTTASA